MKKLIGSLAVLLALFFTRADLISADYNVVESSAQLKTQKETTEVDFRVISLKRFLRSQDSPLSDSAEYFVKASDKYNLDWRMVPAITGVESTFGKRIPRGSYNAYGWANGAYYFNSWEDSIEIVSKTLREKYYDKGATSIYSIARRYAPPSKTWAWKVEYFMDKIDPLPLTFTI